MKINEETTDKLIQYLEGELSPEETKDVDWFIKNDTAWQEEYERVKRSCLKADSAKVYPWKKELKANTGVKALIGKRELSSAAALLVIFLGGWATWNISTTNYQSVADKSVKQTENVQLKKMPLKNTNDLVPFKKERISPENAQQINGLEKAIALPGKEAPTNYPNLNTKPAKSFKTAVIQKNIKSPGLAEANQVDNMNTPDISTKKGIVDKNKSKGETTEEDGLLKTLVVKVFNLKKADQGSNENRYQFKIQGDQHQLTGEFEID